MNAPVSDIAFTPSVKAVQHHRGSRQGYARMEEKGGWPETISEELHAYIATRESFYLGTANKDGQPYIQHRGGRPGFLKVLDEKTLAFADYKGNRQYITTGNLADNDKASIFLMDYAGRRRVKIWGTARTVADDPALSARVADPEYDGIPEQVIVFTVKAWDVNCPQHIPRLYSEQQMKDAILPLTRRIEELEADVQRYRKSTQHMEEGDQR